MSAPAGWHLQPDGQERYWDGQQWTEHVRMPLAADPTAPGDWSASAQDTQALDVSHTTAMPAHDPQSDPYASTGAQAPPSVAAGQGVPPSGHGTPQSGYGAPQVGYGGAQPGQPAYGPPPAQRGNGAVKGCLIAAFVGLVLLALAVAAGFFFFFRTVDRVAESFPTSLPSDFPTDFPTDGPDGPGGTEIEISVGSGFDLPRGQVLDGWTVGSEGAGPVDFMSIQGMRAVPSDDDGLPLLFTMAFEVDDSTTVETVCTAPGGASGSTVDVSCVPLFGDVERARRVTVTSTF